MVQVFSVEDRLQEPVRRGACWEARVGGEAVGSLLGGGQEGVQLHWATLGGSLRDRCREASNGK